MSTSTVAAAKTEARAHPRRIIFILGALTAFASLAIDMYLPAFPAIAAELKVDLGAVELTVSLFLAGMALGQILYGPVSDRWGRRAPLLFGAALYAVAAVGCAWADSIDTLLISRVFMALGGSACAVVTRAVVRDWFEGRQSAHFFSLLMLVMGAAPILAPLLGGQLIALTGWRGIFWLLSGFGVLCFVAIALGLPESLPVSRRTHGGLGKVFANYAHVLRDRRFVAYALAAGFASGLLFAYITGSATAFMEVYHVAPQHFGYYFGGNAVGLIAASQINRRLLERFQPGQILATAFTGVAIVGVLLAIQGVTGWGGLPAMAALLFLMLASTGVIFPNTSALAMEPFPSMAGSASALLGTVQYVLGCAAGALVSLLHNGTAVPMTAIIAFCGVVGGLIARRALDLPGERALRGQ